jgi:hypothetical protein
MYSFEGSGRVAVTAVRVLATLHDFAMLNGLANTPATGLSVQLASQRLAAALSPKFALEANFSGLF